ncbi:MAG: AMP-binding protein [Magnetococcales bacterium]|nr:AMP-binding protein [Magnetococcales bacterium]
MTRQGTPIPADPTLGETLWRAWMEDPDGLVGVFVSGTGAELRCDRRRLLARVQGFADRFAREAEPERGIAAICCHTGLDQIAAFLGALWAGQLPTFLAPPSPRMEPRKYRESFAQMVTHIQPRWMVVDRLALGAVDPAALDGAAGCRLVRPEAVTDATAIRPPAPQDGAAVAVVQHSSGTTGLQKGVALSHGAILLHNRRYAAALDLQADDRVVSWLPLYHDMGFIACFLMPLLERIPFVHLSPFDWARRPALLLEQMARQGGTRCWLPNFAFVFMAESIREGHGSPDLSLSHVRSWIDCSEPVTAAAMDRFVARFAPLGVTAAQCGASYAMAETVFAVTQTPPGATRVLRVDESAFRQQRRIVPLDHDAGALGFVSNGPPLAGLEVRIGAAPEAAEGQVGEIQLRGATCFSGYYRRPDLTAAAFTGDGWYRTGDLGFLWRGEVYVTGRSKELLIIQGRNFHPAEIEARVMEVDGVHPGRAVAFGLADPASGTERLILLAESALETAGDRKRLALKIRAHVAQNLDCTPAEVHVLPRQWLVKSTSGKLARNDNRAKYLRELTGAARHAV